MKNSVFNIDGAKLLKKILRKHFFPKIFMPSKKNNLCKDLCHMLSTKSWSAEPKFHAPACSVVPHSLRYQPIGSEDLLDFFECKGHLILGVGGHEAKADERIVGRNGR